MITTKKEVLIQHMGAEKTGGGAKGKAHDEAHRRENGASHQGETTPQHQIDVVQTDRALENNDGDNRGHKKLYAKYPVGNIGTADPGLN